MKIPQGTVLLLSSGEYGDEYHLDGQYRVEHAFETEDVIEAYLQEHPNQAHEGEANFSQFLFWLTDRGYLRVSEYVEWYLGAHDTFDREEPSEERQKGRACR